MISNVARMGIKGFVSVFAYIKGQVVLSLASMTAAPGTTAKRIACVRRCTRLITEEDEP
jgi:hypothetical protein